MDTKLILGLIVIGFLSLGLYFGHFKVIHDLEKINTKQNLDIKNKEANLSQQKEIIRNKNFEQNITNKLLQSKEELNHENKTINDSIGNHIITL